VGRNYIATGVRRTNPLKIPPAMGDSLAGGLCQMSLRPFHSGTRGTNSVSDSPVLQIATPRGKDVFYQKALAPGDLTGETRQHALVARCICINSIRFVRPLCAMIPNLVLKDDARPSVGAHRFMRVGSLLHPESHSRISRRSQPSRESVSRSSQRTYELHLRALIGVSAMENV
jgi:hypothetical protein